MMSSFIFTIEVFNDWSETKVRIYINPKLIFAYNICTPDRGGGGGRTPGDGESL